MSEYGPSRQMTWDELLADRNALKAELAKNEKAFWDRGRLFQESCYGYQAEISKLKAELEDQKRRGDTYWDLAAEKQAEISKLKSELVNSRKCPECGSTDRVCAKGWLKDKEQLQAELSEAKELSEARRQDIAKLKAEFQFMMDHKDRTVHECNLWKSRAAKYREALEKITKDLIRVEYRGEDLARHVPSDMAQIAQEAIGEAEEPKTWDRGGYKR